MIYDVMRMWKLFLFYCFNIHTHTHTFSVTFVVILLRKVSKFIIALSNTENGKRIWTIV